MRVFVDDDAKFAALAEWTWGLAAACATSCRSSL
jgi:hypothetical protein